jgi:hypothetical protein
MHPLVEVFAGLPIAAEHVLGDDLGQELPGPIPKVLVLRRKGDL